jgi:hypothetical protein
MGFPARADPRGKAEQAFQKTWKNLSRTIDCVTWTCLQMNTHFFGGGRKPGGERVLDEQSTPLIGWQSLTVSYRTMNCQSKKYLSNELKTTRKGWHRFVEPEHRC